MKNHFRVLNLFVLTLFLVFMNCRVYLARAQELIISNVTIVDVVNGELQHAMGVVIDNNLISQVVKSDDIEVESGVEIVDGTDKFLIPGLWDMHVHVLYPGFTESAFKMLLANGVTGVRDMNGPMPLDEIAELKKQIADGEVPGPRLIAPGPLVDGGWRSQRARGDHISVVKTQEAARQAVRSLQQRGADFIKVYHHLSSALFEAIVDEAKRQNIPVVGHLPMVVSARAASTAGMASMEHLNMLLQACSPHAAELRAETRRFLEKGVQNQNPPPAEFVKAFFASQKKIIHSFDDSLATSLCAHFARNGTWQCPTLVSNRASALADLDSEFRSDERLKYVPESIKQNWLQPNRRMGGLTPDERRQNYALKQELVGKMDKAGVDLLAGTDLGTPYIYAGFSLHDELREMVAAGLSPLAALQSATIKPARFMGRLDSLGTIEAGKLADVVLLEANPLENISNTKLIYAVVANGRFLVRATLDGFLRNQAERVAKENAQQDGS